MSGQCQNCSGECGECSCAKERSEATSQMKVTECWTEETAEGYPHIGTEHHPYSWNRDAVIMWREDYDAMRKELEELRKWKQSRPELPADFYTLACEFERVNELDELPYVRNKSGCLKWSSIRGTLWMYLSQEAKDLILAMRRLEAHDPTSED